MNNQIINPQLFTFLSELKENNNREWFAANKNRYDSLRTDFEDFVNNVISGISSFDSNIQNVTAKDCLFRIYKDTRFSKDKTPYKINFGASINKGGRKGITAGYYIHIQPGESFLGGGIYMPQPEILKIIRTEIFENYEEFLKIIHKNFKKYFGELWGEKLKTAPKDFPKDFKGIEYLKLKHFVMIHDLSDSQLRSKSFMEHALKIYEAMFPLNQFINNAIENLQ